MRRAAPVRRGRCQPATVTTSDRRTHGHPAAPAARAAAACSSNAAARSSNAAAAAAAAAAATTTTTSPRTPTASGSATTLACAALGGGAAGVRSRHGRCSGVGARPGQHLAKLLWLNHSSVQQIVDRLECIDQFDTTLAARLPSRAQLVPQGVDVGMRHAGRGGRPQLVRVVHG